MAVGENQAGGGRGKGGGGHQSRDQLDGEDGERDETVGAVRDVAQGLGDGIVPV